MPVASSSRMKWFSLPISSRQDIIQRFTNMWNMIFTESFQHYGWLCCNLIRIITKTPSIICITGWPFVRGIHRWPMYSPHKGTCMWKWSCYYDARLYSCDNSRTVVKQTTTQLPKCTKRQLLWNCSVWITDCESNYGIRCGDGGLQSDLALKPNPPLYVWELLTFKQNAS